MLVSHPAVAEAAAIGKYDEDKDQAIFAYVILEQGCESSEELMQGLRDHVREEIGPTARPDRVIAVDGLPKTRSGKVMRRILERIAEGEEDLGDVTTLADPSVVDTILEQDGR